MEENDILRRRQVKLGTGQEKEEEECVSQYTPSKTHSYRTV